MLELPPNFDREAQLQKKSPGLHELDWVSSSFLQIAARMEQLKIEYFMRAIGGERHDMINVVLGHLFPTCSATTSLLYQQCIYLGLCDGGYFRNTLSSRPPLLGVEPNFVLIFGSPFSVVLSLVDAIVLFVFLASQTRIIAQPYSISLSVFTPSFHKSCVISVISRPFQFQKLFFVGIPLFLLSGRITNKAFVLVKPWWTTPWGSPPFLNGRLSEVTLEWLYDPTGIAFAEVGGCIRLIHKSPFIRFGIGIITCC